MFGLTDGEAQCLAHISGTSQAFHRIVPRHKAKWIFRLRYEKRALSFARIGGICLDFRFAHRDVCAASCLTGRSIIPFRTSQGNISGLTNPSNQRSWRSEAGREAERGTIGTLDSTKTHARQASYDLRCGDRDSGEYL